MSKKTKPKTRRGKKPSPVGSVVWFDIAADNLKRAQKFYSALFGWKIKPMPGMPDYWHINTGGADASPDGALMPRKHPGHGITNYVFVASVDKSVAKLKKLGGKICMPKTAVPKMGYFAVFNDTENNVIAVWEMNPNAK